MEAATIPVEVHRDKNNFCLVQAEGFQYSHLSFKSFPGSLIHCFPRIQVHSEAKKMN
jgi:hypothetical protein